MSARCVCACVYVCARASATQSIFPVCSAAIAAARGVTRFGVILGTLGRQVRAPRRALVRLATVAHLCRRCMTHDARAQGNPAILRRILAKLSAAGKEYVVLLMSEIFPSKVHGARRRHHPRAHACTHPWAPAPRSSRSFVTWTRGYKSRARGSRSTGAPRSARCVRACASNQATSIRVLARAAAREGGAAAAPPL